MAFSATFPTSVKSFVVSWTVSRVILAEHGELSRAMVLVLGSLEICMIQRR